MTSSKEQFFQTLWSRMSRQGDFPTLQFSIDNLVSTLGSDANINALASGVLADFALSQRVLRLANSAMYASFGGDVTTVSRAIMVLGVDTVSHLALGLQLLDNFRGAAASRPQASDALKRAILAGEFARMLSSSQGIHQGEEAVVCTLMHHLSELLVVFYFPDQWEIIQAQAGSTHAALTIACEAVLGVSLEDIASAAALKWRLPELITQTMAEKSLDPEQVVSSRTSWLGAMAEVSSQAASVMAAGGGQEEVRSLLLEHAQTLGLEESVVDAAAIRAESLKDDLGGMASNVSAPRAALPGKPVDLLVRLKSALSATRGFAPLLPVSDLVPLVVETTMQAMNFTNCFVMVLDSQAKRFVARAGFGPGIGEKLSGLVFDEAFVPDVFHFAANAWNPTCVADTFSKETVNRIPRWYREAFPHTMSLVIAPVFHNGRPVALVCGDWGTIGCNASALNDDERTAMKALVAEIGIGFRRNQVAAPAAA
ncbi:MAG: HDOD domain-containing protein [Janthinobacterium lividum]